MHLVLHGSCVVRYTHRCPLKIVNSVAAGHQPPATNTYSRTLALVSDVPGVGPGTGPISSAKSSYPQAPPSSSTYTSEAWPFRGYVGRLALLCEEATQLVQAPGFEASSVGAIEHFVAWQTAADATFLDTTLRGMDDLAFWPEFPWEGQSPSPLQPAHASPAVWLPVTLASSSAGSRSCSDTCDMDGTDGEKDHKGVCVLRLMPASLFEHVSMDQAHNRPTHWTALCVYSLLPTLAV